MIQMGKHADLSFLWIDYKKEHPNGYQLAQFYKLYRDFMVDAYGTSKTRKKPATNRIGRPTHRLVSSISAAIPIIPITI